MRVYIDFDDVICETAKHFCCIAKELFDTLQKNYLILTCHTRRFSSSI